MYTLDIKLTHRTIRAHKDLIPGHEVIGTVVAVGEGEKKWKEGDRVGGAWHGGHDGLCKSCNKGLFQMCENEAINGVTMNGGCTLMTGFPPLQVPYFF
jgi:D-arabinose 1-dehydrogenase-like Zn-dependent alcohol dehydrogenase